MGNKLTKYALGRLYADEDLQLAVSKVLNVKVSSVAVMIHRNSRRLAEYNSVMLISTKLGKEPNEILEPIKRVKKQTVAA